MAWALTNQKRCQAVEQRQVWGPGPLRMGQGSLRSWIAKSWMGLTRIVSVKGRLWGCFNMLTTQTAVPIEPCPGEMDKSPLVWVTGWLLGQLCSSANWRVNKGQVDSYKVLVCGICWDGEHNFIQTLRLPKAFFPDSRPQYLNQNSMGQIQPADILFKPYSDFSL